MEQRLSQTKKELEEELNEYQYMRKVFDSSCKSLDKLTGMYF